MRIYEVKVDFFYEQLGIDRQNPSFSWKSDSKQTAYEIIVAKSVISLENETGLLFDSGCILSSKHIGIVYEGTNLESLSEYYWRVKVWDIEGNLHISEISKFVTGILEKPVILGSWIGSRSDKAFIARKEIILQKKKIKSAYALVCGLGQFEMQVNGNKVSNHVFDPGWTNYDRKIQYVMFDILTYLTRKNAICIEVGNGWYIGEQERYFFHMPEFMPPNPNKYKPFSKYLVCNAKFIVTYEDGSIEEIISDNSWKTHKSPILLANVFGSEIYDAREELEGYGDFGYDDSHWSSAIKLDEKNEPKGILIAQHQPPTIIKQTYKEVEFNEIEEGQVIVDFKQNMSGLFEFAFKNTKPGNVIDMYPAEKLDKNGKVDQMAKGWLMIDTYSTYIAKGDKIERYCPKFAYSAGRFILVKGVTLKENSDKYPTLIEALAHFTTSASKTIGLFQASDNRYEQINKLVEMAVDCNLNNGVHTDCNQIEKTAWLEPNHLMGPAIMYYKDVRDLWAKIFHDSRVDQWTENDWGVDAKGDKVTFGDGLIPSQAPCYERNLMPVPGMGSFYDIIPWGSAQILGVYWHYMFYGNLNVIKENYDSGIRYLNYLKTKVNKDGFINHGLGDWGNPKAENFARENIETAFLYADAITLAKFANWLGKNDDEISLNTYAEKIKENYNEKLLVKHPTKDFHCYKSFDHPGDIYMTQACQALPLYWGLVPEDKKEDVINALRYVLVKDNMFITGEVGQPYIMQVMRDNGMNDLIVRYIMKEEHPSYYAFVLAGETTLGEYWEENPRSHCHDMMGHIMEWFYNGLLGIRLLKPGFSHICIKPWIPSELEEVSGSYQSASGIIGVKVKQLEDRVNVTLNIAGGIHCELDGSLLEESTGKKVIWSREDA